MCNLFKKRSCRKDSSFCINIDRIVYQKDEKSKSKNKDEKSKSKDKDEKSKSKKKKGKGKKKL